jgi:DNA-binding NarL/FixJ family response regulator
VLVVDDHPTFREGLKSLIGHIDGMEVCAEAADEIGALKQLEICKPDMVILDINLGSGSGIRLLPRVRRAQPDVKILVLSMYEESIYGERAIRAGAHGYVCKQDDPDRLVQAIEQVESGQIFTSVSLAARLEEGKASGTCRQSVDPTDLLTERELEIFAWIGCGHSTQEVARKLHVSPKTISTHREHIKKKLDVDDNARLIHWATEWVLTSN